MKVGSCATWNCWTPSGPGGSSGRQLESVPQGCLAGA